jgi:hypothetical protein
LSHDCLVANAGCLAASMRGAYTGGERSERSERLTRSFDNSTA